MGIRFFCFWCYCISIADRVGTYIKENFIYQRPVCAYFTLFASVYLPKLMNILEEIRAKIASLLQTKSIEYFWYAEEASDRSPRRTSARVSRFRENKNRRSRRTKLIYNDTRSRDKSCFQFLISLCIFLWNTRFHLKMQFQSVRADPQFTAEQNVFKRFCIEETD